MTEDQRREVELEVRRVLDSESRTFREELQSQFRHIIWGLGLVGAAAAGVFYFLIGNSAREAEARLVREVDQRVMEYKIVDSLRSKLVDLMGLVLEGDNFKEKIDEVVEERSAAVVPQAVADAMSEQLSDELARLSEESVESLVTRAVEARLCRDGREQCICKTDGGSNKAKLELCVTVCRGGGISSMRIRSITSTTNRVSCGALPSGISWGAEG